MKLRATWQTWEEPDRDVAVVQWRERDVCVVFPRPWAQRHGQRQMIAQAKVRIAGLEGKTQRTLAPGSVVLAFSRHQPTGRTETVNPDVPKGLLTL